MSTTAQRLKAALKPMLPEGVIDRWRLYRFNVEQAQARDRPLADVFNEIYENGVWNPDGCEGQLHSGPGSMPEVTRLYEDFVVRHINADPTISVLVDIGCGDFQVSRRILSRLDRRIRYVGCDIAAVVVADNARRYGDPGWIEFQVCNVATDPLPKGDIVTVREVFQHLSNDTIQAALSNLRQSFKQAIITEAVPVKPSRPNLDIVSGYRTRDGLNSGVYLEIEPFNLRIRDQSETPASPVEVLRTVTVDLDQM